MHVPFYRHDLGGQDADRIAAVLDTPFLTTGEVGRTVERQLADYFGIPHALLVNSCTNGAIAVLLALDIGRGDEVIVPAMTFIASANVVELVGAKPVFVDVDPATLLMQPEAVARALTAKTRAVMPVHLYGQMCDVQAIRDALGNRHDIAIIEDAAHAFEAMLNGDRPGAHSDAAIFSFYATKNVTCGEGGAVVTRHVELADKLRQTRLHGMSAGAVDRFRQGSYQHWDMIRLGTKANLPDLLAALLGPQIDTIDERLPTREAKAGRYEAALAGTAIRMPARVQSAAHARHLFPVHVPPAARDSALTVLANAKIGATVNYRSVPTLTYYRNAYGYEAADFPISYAWGEGTFSLPLFPRMSEDEQEYVIDVLHRDILPLATRAAR